MASKLRSARETQKAAWQEKLAGRMNELKDMGVDGKSIEKDAIIRKLKAKVREATFRLTAIVAREKKLEDMARIKEEKKAAPPKEKGKKAAPVEDAKSKKKEKKKEGQEKAPKKEPKKKADAAAS
jgi:hypothetical protein